MKKRRPAVDLGRVVDGRDESEGQELYRIGEVADRLDVSTRTLRYYEELGLAEPSSYTAGGSRRYTKADIVRLVRIRELQAVMGFDLEEIADILAAEDSLGELQREYQGDVSAERRAQIIIEVAERNARTQEQVVRKFATLQAFLADLEASADEHRSFAAEYHITLPQTCTPTFQI